MRRAFLAALLALALAPLPAHAVPWRRTGTVVGWVRDSLSGKPVHSCLWASSDPGRKHWFAIDSTDGLGRFRLRLPAGKHWVFVRACPQLSRSQQLRVPVLVRPGRVDTVRIRISSDDDAWAMRPRTIPSDGRRDSSGSIMGWVRDSLSGLPVAFANVVILDWRQGTQTDASGRFRIVTVPAGEHRVQVTGSGYHSVERLLVVRPAAVDTVEFHLQSTVVLDYHISLASHAAAAVPRDTTGTVVGWVRDSLSGRALPYASVVVQGTHVGTSADTSGWFRIARVPAGERVISALALGFRRGAAPVRVRAARTDTVWLRLRVMPIPIMNIDWATPRQGPRPQH